MSNFWKSLPKPFLVLAPMEDVTDVVFREIIAGLPKPDVFFTEFTNADGLFSKGRDVVIRKLKYTEKQRPIVAQIWGNDPAYMYKAARLVRELGFDGVDINMGCPDKSVMKKGAGASHIGNYDFSKKVISAVKKGANGLPVSIKTRIGKNKIITEDWITFLLSQSIDALTIHGRIAIQMSKGQANWNEIGKAVKIKNKISSDTLIIGNGDVKTYTQVNDMHKKYGVDGVMIGRGLFSNPWVFERKLKFSPHDRKSYVQILLKHIALFEETWGDIKQFEIMRKFFKMYIKDFDGANQLRQKLMECKNSSEVVETVKSFAS